MFYGTWIVVQRCYKLYYRSKELRELIMRMEHQSPHLLDTMEQVISFLHADWQQLKRDCDNLNNKLKR